MCAAKHPGTLFDPKTIKENLAPFPMQGKSEGKGG